MIVKARQLSSEFQELVYSVHIDIQDAVRDNWSPLCASPTLTITSTLRHHGGGRPVSETFPKSKVRVFCEVYDITSADLEDSDCNIISSIELKFSPNNCLIHW